MKKIRLKWQKYRLNRLRYKVDYLFKVEGLLDTIYQHERKIEQLEIQFNPMLIHTRH